MLGLSSGTNRPKGCAANGASYPLIEWELRLILTTLVAGLIFLWPLFVHGKPAYIPDSASYFKGGQRAASHVENELDRTLSTIVRYSGASLTNKKHYHDGQSTQASDGEQNFRGARSVTYSILSFILGAPGGSMWLLAAFQALSVGLVVSITLFVFETYKCVPIARIALLAAGTPVAFVSTLVVPDIFTAITILSITLLACAYDRLSKSLTITLALLASAAVTFHMSNFPIAFVMTLAGLAVLAWPSRRPKAILTRRGLLVATPVLVGSLVTLVLNFAAFGSPSLTGERFPLTLARSVAEGPGKWYLEENCSRLRYAICEIYPDRVPGDMNEFLWGENGLDQLASVEQLDRIRSEERDVVLAATKAYPLQELARISLNFVKQLVSFKPQGFDSRIQRDAHGIPHWIETPSSNRWVSVVYIASVVGITLSLAAMVYLWASKRDVRTVIAMTLIGIAINAAVCVYFSGTTGRYQARVIWLIPLIVLASLGRTATSVESPHPVAPE